MKLDLAFWKKTSSKRKRIYSGIIILILALMATMIGSLATLTVQEANDKNDALNQMVTEIKQNGTIVQSIFLNNFVICLLMFIPVVGPVLGFFILFNTGTYLAATSMVQGIHPLLGFGLLAIFPHFWLEYFAYSIAMAESIWLFWRLINGRIRELKIFGIVIAISAGLLLAGALVEGWLINLAI